MNDGHRGFIERCEQEALHFSGAIMPHGALLVCAPDGSVTHASVNVEAFLGLPPEALIGRAMPALLAARLVANPPRPGRPAVVSGIAGSDDHALEHPPIRSEQSGREAAAQAFDSGAVSYRPDGYIRSESALDMLASVGADGALALELFRSGPMPLPAGGVVRTPITPADEAECTDLRRELVSLIAQASGFQRVMFYSFHPDGDGEVVAEARGDGAFGSYLGLRFPASDIPQIARTLYLRNPWRMIPDAGQAPIALQSATGAPPDLSCSDLRSVSEVHRAYLGNMGVRAALSFPVASGGRLTALIACHHREPRQLSLPLLDALSQIVRNHALAIASYETRRRIRLVDGLKRHFAGLDREILRQGDLFAAWPEIAPVLMADFTACGAVLAIGDRIATCGETFEPDAFAVLDNWFRREARELVFTADSLSRQLAGYPLSGIAGVAALRLRTARHERLRLYLTREELIHEIAWGGNPDKPTETDEGGLPISPRRSFERWVERRIGYSRPWDTEAQLRLGALRELLVTRAGRVGTRDE